VKNNSVIVLYHTGKEDLKELMTKLVLIKISREEKVREYNKDIKTTVTSNENREG